MQAGDLDIYPVVPLKGAEALLRNTKIDILTHASADYRSLHMRVDQPPFNDKRVRQAVALCLDREAIAKSLFNGAAGVANDHSFAPVYVDTQLAVRDLPQRKQDYQKAKALLAQAGHAQGLTVTLTTENLLEMPQYAVAIKAYCAPAGINVNLNIMPSAQDLWGGCQPALARGAVRHDRLGGSRHGEPAIIPEFPCGAAWNSAHWCDKNFDSTFASYNAELDHQKRQKLALQLATFRTRSCRSQSATGSRRAGPTAKSVHGLAAAPDNFLDLRGVWLA